MTLMLVMLISVYLAEFTFSTVVDLRGMHNIRSSLLARNLARSAFRALQIGLLQDELEFMSGYRQLQPLLTVGALPMEDGLLLILDIQPLDALYNLNELSGLRSNTTSDDASRGLFQNTMALMRSVF